MKNQKATIIALLCLGIISLVSQVILIRELIIAFYGNELFISVVLALWLMSTGLGSILSTMFFKADLDKVLMRLYFITPFILAGVIILARAARVILSSSGIEVNFIRAVLWCLLIIGPVGLIIGALFVLLARVLKDFDYKKVSLAYIVESAGFTIGAIAFSFYLYKLGSLEVISLVAILFFIFALLHSFKFSTTKSFMIVLVIIIIAVSLNWSSRMDKYLYQWHFKNEKIIVAQHTKFNSINITKTNEQINFYQNGHFVNSSQDKFNNELLTHLPMLVAPSVDNVLVIGNGYTGILNEIKKYNPVRVDYLELDKNYGKIVSKLGFKLDDEVKVYFEDARYFLNRAENKYNVVIINYANPATLAENRYFTKEFFSLVKSQLAKGGIVAIKINVAPNYIVGAQNDLLATLFWSLKDAYKNVYALPDNEVVYLASSEPVVFNIDEVEQKYKNYNLNNDYLIPALVAWRFTNDRTRQLNDQLIKTKRIINSDFKPTLYYGQLKIFLEKMGINYINIFWSIIIIGVILLLYLLISIKQRKENNRQYLLLLISGIGEFCLMSFEVLLILMFQVWHGYLYTQLSLIIALVLLGIAIGSYLFYLLLDRKDENYLARLSYLIILISFIIFLIVFLKLNFLLNYKFAFYLLGILAGLAIGTKFPVINKLYLKNPLDERAGNSNLGAVYGIDLISAAVGALLIGVFMLPILGVIGSLEAMVGLCFISNIIIFFYSSTGKTHS